MDQEILDQTGGADDQANEQVIETPENTSDVVVEEKAAPAEPEFVADYKFRANQQDMEIPEEFRAHIKDVESQKKIKDMFEKYHGFDAQKQRMTSLESDAANYRNQLSNLASNIQNIQQSYAHAVKSGNLHNLDMVFQQLGIGEDVLMSWAGEKARLHGLDPEQRDVIMRRNELERQNYENSLQQNSLYQKNIEQDRQIRQMQFDSAMATPEIQNFAKELDTKFGSSGLFAEEVVKAGQMAYALEKKILTVPEAMQAVITKYGLKGAPVQAQAQVQQPAGNMAADGKKIVQRDTKTIPNVGSSGGASPVGAGKAKSLDDIRNRYKQLAAQDG